MRGLLLVLAEPGTSVPVAEFNDWYDDEHVPLRIPIPAFHTWSRWVALDNHKPSYLACYNLTDPDAINQPPYSDLANTRSERETSILARIALLDRRGYSSLPVPIPPKPDYDPHSPGPFIAVIFSHVAPDHEEDLNRWYDEEHVAAIAKTPSWVRSTRFVYRDGGVFGTDDSLKPNGEEPAKYLAVHEFSADGFDQTEEMKAALSTPWSQRIFASALLMEVRHFKLLRTWKRD
ncbi:uncharacterized protein BXZ73DRAFT_45801 [Epithele typhae]|uniref:uncharacterized protein n=1 Tax=Epithele typhae TaxID=378194 RepID=UPI002007CB8A|nr:uncharacterized protein BXZ73DRAFT_45801 [Epithele typhae]KAH9934449.1 hypothetical protein BXZ73DRAFT_45801 [Epithele typhae]